MSLASYTDLTAAVADWMARADTKFTGRVADHITLAEARIWRRVRLNRGKSAPTVLTIPAGTGFAALPSDFLGLVWVKSVDGPLRFEPIEVLQNDLVGSGATGDDSAYSLDGQTFYYGTTPDADTDLTMVYYQRPAALSVAAANDLWLLETAPDIYLYASLLEAAIYTKRAGGSDKVAEFGALLDKAIAEAKSADQAALMPEKGRLLMRRAGARMGYGVAN
jgi:hypothetical protein